MPAPTIEQTKVAAGAIASMGEADFLLRRRSEAGDTLIAYFVILARKLFAEDAAEQTAQRVEMMLASWFLRGEVEGKKAAPTDPAAAKKAVEKVAALDGAGLGQRMNAEVGDAILAFFTAFQHKTMPETDPDRRARAVQLMILAYLLRGDL